MGGENKESRIHCFVGDIKGVKDVCNDKNCEERDCMWNEEHVRKPSSLTSLENKTEGLATGMYS
jgi:hypothetical protein